MFYTRYAELCERAEISPSRAATEMGINKSSVTYWKTKGATPSAEILAKIESYFKADLSEWAASRSAASKKAAPKPQFAEPPAEEVPPSAEAQLPDEDVLPPVEPTAEEAELPAEPRYDGTYYESRYDAAPDFTRYSETDESAHAIQYMTTVLEQEFRADHPELMGAYETLGQRIARLRRARNISVEEIAEQVGTDPETYEAWERDELPIRRYRLQKIANALEVKPEALNPLTVPENGTLTREGVVMLLNKLKDRSDVLSLVAAAEQTSPTDVETAIRFLQTRID